MSTEAIATYVDTVVYEEAARPDAAIDKTIDNDGSSQRMKGERKRQEDTDVGEREKAEKEKDDNKSNEEISYGEYMDVKRPD